MTIVDQIASTHVRIQQALGRKPSRADEEPSDMQRERGWVPFPLSDQHVAELEQIVGFAFPPLLRALFQTRDAMSSNEKRVGGIDDWVGSYAFEKNRDIASAREKYDWDLPKLVAISWDEDFLAVTEDSKVVRVCSNEGNIDSRHGTLEVWLERYLAEAKRYADDPARYAQDEDEDEDLEDEEDEDDE